MLENQIELKAEARKVFLSRISGSRKLASPYKSYISFYDVILLLKFYAGNFDRLQDEFHGKDSFGASNTIIDSFKEHWIFASAFERERERENEVHQQPPPPPKKKHRSKIDSIKDPTKDIRYNNRLGRSTFGMHRTLQIHTSTQNKIYTKHAAERGGVGGETDKEKS